MNGFTSDNTEYITLLGLYPHPLPGYEVEVHTAYRREIDISVLIDIFHHIAYLIDMPGKHYAGRTFHVHGSYYVAVDVDFYFLGVFRGLLLIHSSRFFFVSRRAVAVYKFT